MLSGFLIDRVFDNSGINRSRSFIIITDDDIKEEFFANQRLAQIIHKHELFGKYLEITYIGDEKTGYGHARKIYKVVKVAGITDNAGLHLQTELLNNQKRRKENGRNQQPQKNGRRRPARDDG